MGPLLVSRSRLLTCNRRHIYITCSARAKARAAPPAVTRLEWAKPLTIVKYPDPRLRAPNARINVFGDSLLQLASEMLEIMYTDDGVGLAAPQVGVNVRLMVFNETGQRGNGEEKILVNPEIVGLSKTKELDTEGCLSFPGILGDVERALEIVVKAQDETGKEMSMRLRDFPARIFQHEYDHLQGVLFFERMKPKVLDSIRPELLKMEEFFIASNPTVAVQRVPPPAAARVAAPKKGFGG